jgi:hypothetical protein
MLPISQGTLRKKSGLPSLFAWENFNVHGSYSSGPLLLGGSVSRFARIYTLSLPMARTNLTATKNLALNSSHPNTRLIATGPTERCSRSRLLGCDSRRVRRRVRMLLVVVNFILFQLVGLTGCPLVGSVKSRGLGGGWSCVDTSVPALCQRDSRRFCFNLGSNVEL